MQTFKEKNIMLEKMMVIWNNLDCLNHCDNEMVAVCAEMVQSYGLDIESLPECLYDAVQNKIYLNKQEDYYESMYDACYG